MDTNKRQGRWPGHRAFAEVVLASTEEQEVNPSWTQNLFFRSKDKILWSVQNNPSGKLLGKICIDFSFFFPRLEISINTSTAFPEDSTSELHIWSGTYFTSFNFLKLYLVN